MPLKISLVMNVYDYIFCKMYKSIYKTNKIYPEIFTCMYLSTLLSVNIYTLLLFLMFPITKVTVITICGVSIFILSINYLHFLKRDKYKVILNKCEELDKAWIAEKLAFLYPQITFCLLFVSLNVDFWRIVLLLLLLFAISITEIISFFKGNKNSPK
jgi:hypothetical protein